MSDAAFYRCEVKTVSRASGRSATAAAAYRAAERIADMRTGEDHDYRRRRGVEHTEIVLPDSAPEELRDRGALWNAAEQAEKRKNARVAREVLVSIPNELDQPEQRVGLVRQMAQWIVGTYGVAADFAVHEPDKHEEADERNYHAHILITTRQVDQDGLGKKTRELDDKLRGPEEIERIREAWEDIGNRHLSAAGHEPSLDRRSLKDRGIDREPEPKLGPIANEMERDGRPSNAGDDRRAVIARNMERARLLAERKVIDLEIERERRRQKAFEPSQLPGQKRPERQTELNPSLLRKQTQDRHLEELGRLHDDAQASRHALKARLDQQYRESAARDLAALKALQERMQERPRLAAWWAGISGRARREADEEAALKANLANVEWRVREAEGALNSRNEAAHLALEQRQAEERRQDEALIAQARTPVANDPEPAREAFQRAVNDPTPDLAKPSGPDPQAKPDPKRDQEISEDYWGGLTPEDDEFLTRFTRKEVAGWKIDESLRKSRLGREAARQEIEAVGTITWEELSQRIQNKAREARESAPDPEHDRSAESREELSQRLQNEAQEAREGPPDREPGPSPGQGGRDA